MLRDLEQLGLHDCLAELGELAANRRDRLVQSWHALQRWASGESSQSAEKFRGELLNLYQGTDAMHTEMLITEYKAEQERLSSEFMAIVDQLRAIGTLESLIAVRNVRQQTTQMQQALDQQCRPPILEYLCKGRMFAELLRYQNELEDEDPDNTDGCEAARSVTQR